MQEFYLRHFDIEQDGRGWNLGSIIAILSGDLTNSTLHLQFDMPFFGLGVGPAIFSWLTSGDVYTWPEAFIQEVKNNAGIVHVQALVYLDKQSRPSPVMKPEGLAAVHNFDLEKVREQMEAQQAAWRSNQAFHLDAREVWPTEAIKTDAPTKKELPSELIERLRSANLQINPRNIDYAEPLKEQKGQAINRAEEAFIEAPGYRPEPQHLLHEPPIGLSELFSGELQRKLEERAMRIENATYQPSEPPHLALDPDEEPPKPIDPTFEE